MDITTLTPVERYIEIKHPKTDADIGIRISLYPPHGPEVKKAVRKFTDRNTHLQARGKVMSATETETFDNDIIIAAMQGWEWYGDIDLNGEKPKFTRENVIKVFEMLPWLKKQVADELNATENFIAA